MTNNNTQNHLTQNYLTQNHMAENHLTEKEAGHLADNLWLYRLRYRKTREAMARGDLRFRRLPRL